MDSRRAGSVSLPIYPGVVGPVEAKTENVYSRLRHVEDVESERPEIDGCACVESLLGPISGLTLQAQRGRQDFPIVKFFARRRRTLTSIIRHGDDFDQHERRNLGRAHRYGNLRDGV